MGDTYETPTILVDTLEQNAFSVVEEPVRSWNKDKFIPGKAGGDDGGDDGGDGGGGGEGEGGGGGGDGGGGLGGGGKGVSEHHL